jgi:hypothetical protein
MARDLMTMVMQAFLMEMEWSTRFGGVRRTHGCGQRARSRPGATRSGDWSGGELRLWSAASIPCGIEQKKTMKCCARTGEIVCDKKEGMKYLVAVGNVG